jgi:hypothetical protein
MPDLFNPLNTKRRLLYLKTQFASSYRAVNTFHLGYKNQSVYAVSGTSRCLFSDKYKTHKYSVGRTYSCWMLNCWCITWPVGFKRLMSNYMVHNMNIRLKNCPHKQFSEQAEEMLTIRNSALNVPIINYGFSSFYKSSPPNFGTGCRMGQDFFLPNNVIT